MHYNQPYLRPVGVLIGSGILLGLAVRALMPVSPLPAPEPTWRKTGAAPVEVPWSAETYPVDPQPRWAAADDSAGPVIHWDVPDYPEYAPSLERTRYDELPRYEAPPYQEEPRVAEPPVPAEESRPVTAGVSEPQPDEPAPEPAIAVGPDPA